MFDTKKWHHKIFEDVVRYGSLEKYVYDAELFEKHIEINIVTKISAEKTNNEIDKEADITEQINTDHFILVQAIESYKRHMIVMCATTIEGVFFDFFQTLFISRPKAMYGFINDTNSKYGKGCIKLTEAVGSKSLEELISNLATRASKNATNGSIEKICKRVYQITKQKIKNTTIQSLQAIIDKRNEIVHEATNLEVPKSEVLDSIDQAADLIFELKIILANMGILDSEAEDFWRVL